MKKYTHKKGVKPTISESEIIKLRNFDALKTNYQRAVYDIHKKPVYKNPRFFFALLMVLLVAYLLFEMADKEQKSEAENPKQQTENPK
jgi:hypothetical protein